MIGVEDVGPDVLELAVVEILQDMEEDVLAVLEGPHDLVEACALSSGEATFVLRHRVVGWTNLSRMDQTRRPYKNDQFAQ